MFQSISSTLMLEVCNLHVKYQNCFFECTTTACHINGQQALFFIFVQDKITAIPKYMIGTFTGDIKRVDKAEKIEVMKRDTIDYWEIDVIEEIKREENVVDVFLLSELNNDQRLIFQSDQLAQKWYYMLLNSQEVNKNIQKQLSLRNKNVDLSEEKTDKQSRKSEEPKSYKQEAESAAEVQGKQSMAVNEREVVPSDQVVQRQNNQATNENGIAPSYQVEVQNELNEVDIMDVVSNMRQSDNYELRSSIFLMMDQLSKSK